MRPLWTTVALAALLPLSPGCQEQASDDDSALGDDDAPEACDSLGLPNVSFRFDIVVEGVAYDASYFTELLAYYGIAAYELVYDGVVADKSESGSESILQVDLIDPYYGEVWASIYNYYSLPDGVNIPVALGDDVTWRAMVNYRNGVLKLGAQMADPDQCLLFYAEPGRRPGFTGAGLAYDNLKDSPSRIFTSVVPEDHDCPFSFQTDCGEQYNLALGFQVTDGEEFDLFPGESHTTAFTESFKGGATCQGDYEVTNVVSYDWRNVDPECPDPDGVYERAFSFYVVRK